jgi:hypothetical protein
MKYPYLVEDASSTRTGSINWLEILYEWQAIGNNEALTLHRDERVCAS